jgi:hypothetical protein
MKNRKLVLGLLICTLVGVITSSTKAFPSISLNTEGDETWTMIGPNNIGGRVRTVMFDKYNQGVVYAGAVGGGLYVSVNNGRNWQELTLGNGEGLAVTALAQDENGIIYVGTGDGFYASTLHNEDPTGHSNNTSGMIGTGVYKMSITSNFSRNWANNLSTDAAKYAFITNPNNVSFLSISSTVPPAYDNTSDWAFINTMTCVGTTLYVGTRNSGLKESKDGGNTFSTITIGNNAAVNVTDLKVNSNNRIAVAYIDNGGKIAVSAVDNGDSFTNIFNNTSIGLSEDTVALGRIALAFGEHNPDTLYAFVATNASNSIMNINGTLQGVYRTVNINNPSWSNIAPSTLGNGGNLGYAMSICVNDRESNNPIVYIGGNDIERGFDANGENAPYYWTALSSSYAVDTTGSYVAPNIHNILLMPNPTTEYDSIFMLVSTDAGIFTYNYDTIIHSLQWYPSSTGMNSLQAYKVAGGADGSVIAATQSNAITYMPSTSDSTLKRGQIIWSINNPGYLGTVNNYGDDYMTYTTTTMSGSNVKGFGIYKTLPSIRKPFVVSRPNNNIARTYGSSNGSYEAINDQTWTFGGGVTQTLLNENSYTNLLYCQFNTPMAMWETFNAPQQAQDSVELKLTTNTAIHRNGAILDCKDGREILQGDSVLAESDNLAYPFFHVFKATGHNNGDTLFYKNNDTTINVPSPIQARLLIATNTGAFICGKILDFSRTFSTDPSVDDLAWAKIFHSGKPSDSTAALNTRIHAVALSMDGNYAFIAVDKYSNYNTYANTYVVRVKGLNEVNLANAILFKGAAYDTTFFTREVIGTFNRQISSITCNPLDSNKMVLTFDGYSSSNPNVMYSNNVLSTSPTFTGIALNPNNSSANVKPVFTSLIESMNNTNGKVLYIGSDDGLYKTNDYTAANVSWVKESGVPQIPVFDLWQQTNNLPNIHYYVYTNDNSEETQFDSTTTPGIMYAATYGKGLLMNKANVIANKPSVSIQDVRNIKENVTLNVYPNPASTNATISYSLNNASNVMFKVYDMNGREISSLNKGMESKGQHNQVIEVSHLSQGVYIIKMITNSSARTAKLIVR